MTEEQIKQKAEEYFENECLHSYADTEEQLKEDVVPAYISGYHEGFKDCAKARLNTTTISDCPIKDEWHYVKNGDLPKEYDTVIVCTEDTDLHKLFLICNYHYNKWWFADGKTIDDVIAWKEIIPPKELE